MQCYNGLAGLGSHLATTFIIVAHLQKEFANSKVLLPYCW